VLTKGNKCGTIDLELTSGAVMLNLQISLAILDRIEQELPGFMSEIVEYLWDYGFYADRIQSAHPQYQLLNRLDNLSARVEDGGYYISETCEELYQMHICIFAGYFTVEDIIGELISVELSSDLAAKLHLCYNERGFDINQFDHQSLVDLGSYTTDVWNLLGVGNHFKLAGKANSDKLVDCYGPELPEKFVLKPFKGFVEFVDLLSEIDESLFAQWVTFEESTDSDFETKFQSLSIKAATFGASFNDQGKRSNINWLEIFSSAEEFGEYGSLVILTRTQKGLSQATVRKLEWIADLLGKFIRTHLSLSGANNQFAKDCATMMYAKVADFYDVQPQETLNNIKASHALFLDLDPIIRLHVDGAIFTRLCNWVVQNSPTEHVPIGLLYNWGGDLNHFWGQEEQTGIRFTMLLNFRMWTEYQVDDSYGVFYTNDYFGLNSMKPWSNSSSEKFGVFKLALEYEAGLSKSTYLSLLVGIRVLRIKEDVLEPLWPLAYVRFLEFLKSDHNVHKSLATLYKSRQKVYDFKEYGMLVSMLTSDSHTLIVVDDEVIAAIFG
jgi:hypothetical protein